VKELYATCILTRLIDAFPFLLSMISPPLGIEQMLRAMEIAPANCVMAIRQ
jgi:hypothetical protein